MAVSLWPKLQRSLRAGGSLKARKLAQEVVRERLFQCDSPCRSVRMCRYHIECGNDIDRRGTRQEGRDERYFFAEFSS